jgi:hypothetical protein
MTITLTMPTGGGIFTATVKIMNYKLSIVNYELSIVNYELSIVNYEL